jgi:hypothetical protein
MLQDTRDNTIVLWLGWRDSRKGQGTTTTGCSMARLILVEIGSDTIATIKQHGACPGRHPVGAQSSAGQGGVHSKLSGVPRVHSVTGRRRNGAKGIAVRTCNADSMTCIKVLQAMKVAGSNMN